MKSTHYLLFLLCVFAFNADATSIKNGKKKTSKSGVTKVSEAQKLDLSNFPKRDGLLNPLSIIEGAPNRFDKETIYSMKNFKIVQKIKDGYLITADAIVWSSGNSLEFGIAFLKTSKVLPQDILISGEVIYDGSFNYKALNGFDQVVPLLKIPGDLPLTGIIPYKDPFKTEFY